MQKQPNIALFIDTDNFVGFCDQIGLPMELDTIIEKITEGGERVSGGKITVRRSYGDLHKLVKNKLINEHNFRQMLLNNLIQHEDVIYVNQQKNSADIRLVIEALDVAYTNQHIEIFVIIANDKDFIPLFAKLRQMGKQVIGVGGSKIGTSSLYAKSCDAVYYYENICNSDHINATANLQERDLSPEAGFRLLLNAINSLTTNGRNPELEVGNVVRELNRQNSDFDVRNFGFVSFRQMCEEAELQKIIKMIFKNDVWYHILLPEAVKEVPTVAEIPAPVETTKPVILEKEESVDTAASLRSWIENKMSGLKEQKIHLPSFEERLDIYSGLHFIDDQDYNLKDLSYKIYNEVRDSAGLSQQAIYKTLYSLYRGGAFSCSPGESPMNPIIRGMAVYSDEKDKITEYLEEKFVSNSMRVYRGETGHILDAQTWSKAIYNSTEKTELMNTWIRQI